MPPLPILLSTPGEHVAPPGRTPPPRSSVTSANLRDLVSSASCETKTSCVASNGGLTDCSCWFSKPMWWTVPFHWTPSSDGEPIFCHSDTIRLCALPPTLPLWQSTTCAPVVKFGAAVDDARRLQGRGVPRGLSSVKSLGVPRSSNAPFMSSITVANRPAQASVSSG